MSNTDLIFEEPPAKKSSPGRPPKWVGILSPLRDHPGQWARLAGTYTQPTASNIKSGKLAGLAQGDWDATSRKVPDEPGRFHIYVRFVGHLKVEKQGAA